jgi:hypothetical protein
MNRYKSSQKWRKIEAGCYESPDGRFAASISAGWGKPMDGLWHLWDRDNFDPANPGPISSHLTLADCQEIAEGRQ